MKTKSILLISIAALVALSGCSSHLALVDFGKPATSFAALPRKPSPAAAPTTVAATSLAAADAQVEKVTVTAAAKITAATAKLRAEAPASVFVSKTADEIDAAVASVLAEIKAHPSVVVAYVVTAPNLCYADIKKGDLVLYFPKWTPSQVLHQAAQKDAGGWIMSGLNNAHYEAEWRVTPENFNGIIAASFIFQ